MAWAVAVAYSFQFYCNWYRTESSTKISVDRNQNMKKRKQEKWNGMKWSKEKKNKSREWAKEKDRTQQHVAYIYTIHLLWLNKNKAHINTNTHACAASERERMHKLNWKPVSVYARAINAIKYKDIKCGLIASRLLLEAQTSDRSVAASRRGEFTAVAFRYGNYTTNNSRRPNHRRCTRKKEFGAGWVGEMQSDLRKCGKCAHSISCDIFSFNWTG